MKNLLDDAGYIEAVVKKFFTGKAGETILARLRGEPDEPTQVWESTVRITFVRDGGKVHHRMAWGSMYGCKPSIEDHIWDMMKIHGQPKLVVISIRPGLPENIDSDLVRTLT